MSSDRGRFPDALIVAGLLVVSLLLTLPYSGDDVVAHHDGLFYDAQMREIQGESRDEALREAFQTPMARELAANERRDLEPDERRVEDPQWAEYSADFYRRRWTVPVLAAGLEPVVGQDRALEQAALIGWALLTPLLFLLLRRRFSQVLSVAAAGFCALLPPVLSHGHLPVTDSWGLTLLVAGLLLAVLVRERGPAWLIPWFLVVLALSFTRDLTIVLVIAAGWLAFRERTGRMAALVGTGVLASLPAPLLFSANLRESLAYTFNDFRVPTDDSWSHIVSAYPGELVDLLRQDALYPGSSPFPTPLTLLMGLVALAAIYFLLVPFRQRDPYLSLIRASAVGGLLTILITVNYTGLRLEMVFVPAIAVGAALLGERLLSSSRRPLQASRPHP